MTRRSMVEYAEAMRGRYGAAGRKEKQRILDEHNGDAPEGGDPVTEP